MHEKSLLLALFPAGLLLLDDVTSVTWFQIFGSFSMYPLLKRDGLGIPYFACNALYIIMSYYLSEIRKTIVPGVTSEGIYNRNVGTKLLRLFKNSALFLSSVGKFSILIKYFISACSFVCSNRFVCLTCLREHNCSTEEISRFISCNFCNLWSCKFGFGLFGLCYCTVVYQNKQESRLKSEVLWNFSTTIYVIKKIIKYYSLLLK